MNPKITATTRFIYVLPLMLILALIGCGGTVSEPVAPAVESPAPPESTNEAPVITSLTADLQVQPQDKAQVVCEATDVDGDNLTYCWSCTDGILEGSSATVTWTAPQAPGNYTVTVVVSDGKGGVAKKDLTITVPEKPNNPPVIEGIKFQWEGHMPTTIKPNMTEKEKKSNHDPVIRIWEPANITCLASDPDNDSLSYKWLANAGTIKSVEGWPPESVRWIAPGAGGTYTVTCRVSDEKGLTDTFTINITVKCCGV